MPLRRPETSEYPERYAHYVALAPEEDLPAALLAQLDSAALFTASIPQAKHPHRYAEGKWTITEVLGHILDTERIIAHRILTWARGADAAFTRADENLYVRNGAFAARPLSGIMEEFALLRRSHALMLEALPEEAWDRAGVMADSRVTVRAAAYLMLGHERHHLNIIRERYL